MFGQSLFGHFALTIDRHISSRLQLAFMLLP